MAITTKQIKELREQTNAGVMDCKKALEESGGDVSKALVWLKKKGMARAEKRAEREVKSGLLEAYNHGQGQIVAVVELACETDFVARTDEFQNLAKEIAMQVAAMAPKTVEDLLKQPYIRKQELTIEDLVKELIAKTGENMVVRRIARFEFGE